MKNKDANLYVAIIRFGEQKLEEGVTFAELKQHIDSSYSISEDRLSKLFYDFYQIVWNEDDPFKAQPIDLMKIPGRKSTLTSESYFRLLDYTELHEARQSSRKALWFAGAAMILAAVLSLVSIFVQLTPCI